MYKYKDDTLVKKAKQFAPKSKKRNPPRKLTQAEMDLVFACLYGEITGKQFAKAMGVNYSSATVPRYSMWILRQQLNLI